MMNLKRHGFGRAFFLVLSTVLLSTALLAVSSLHAQDPVQQAIAQARFYAQAELTKQALQALEPLRSEPQIRVETARILFVAQDWNGAADEYAKLLAEYPEQEVLRRNLLVSLYRAERDDRAKEILALFGTSAEENARVLTIRGLLAEREGRRKDAIADLQTAISLDPSDTFAAYELGLLFLAAGETEDAIAPLEEAVRRNPQMAQASYNLGQALVRSGRSEEGRKAIAQSQKITHEINTERTRRMRAVALARRAQGAAEQGDFEKALSDLDHALEILPEDSDLRTLRENIVRAKEGT